MADKEISVSVWFKSGGGIMTNRWHLPVSHPEYIYNYIKREFGVNPEDYGVKKPDIRFDNPELQTCPHCGTQFKGKKNGPINNCVNNCDISGYYDIDV